MTTSGLYLPASAPTVTIAGLLTRFLAAISSAVLLFLAQPPVNAGWLGWIAFVPLTVVCLSSSLRTAAILGFISGLAAEMMIAYWVVEAPGFNHLHSFILGSYLALYTAFWCALVAHWARYKGLVFAAPTAWVVLDYLRANAGFLAASWGTLAQTQHDNLPLVQLATIAGEYGVTFAVMLMNISVVRLAGYKEWRLPGVAIILIVFAHIWGWSELSRMPQGVPVTVAALQPNIEPEPAIVPYRNSGALNKLERLTQEVSQTRLDLIVWPEGSVQQWKRGSAAMARIEKIAKLSKTAMLVGATENQKYLPKKQSDGGARKVQQNTAFLVRADGTFSEPYHKNLLLPFAEYVPLRGVVEWPAWLVPDLESLTQGNGTASFPFGEEAYVSPIICWENIFADYVRRAVPDRPVVIAHIANLNAFGKTGAAAQHNASSVFRAVENRTPVVIATNTGPSQILDASGRVVSQVEAIFSEGTAVGTVYLYGERTPYWKFGDAFVLLLTVGLVLFAAFSMRKEG